MWNDLLIFSKWLETTRLSHLMAGGWKWGWPTCETLHFIGLSLLLGCIGVVDLRMLGVGKSMPGGPVHKLVPWAIAGFLINAVTGALFFIGAPHQYIKNVAFLFKMLFLVVASAASSTKPVTRFSQNPIHITGKNLSMARIGICRPTPSSRKSRAQLKPTSIAMPNV